MITTIKKHRMALCVATLKSAGRCRELFGIDTRQRLPGHRQKPPALDGLAAWWSDDLVKRLSAASREKPFGSMLVRRQPPALGSPMARQSLR
ncbi:MAG: hypothetical protein LBV05_04390 [Comamonas sp.]|uniref:hypothetical protein n=1 Tax=Comamonas sp. TaxID=34028 RepID=UPI0012BFA176|nr:hypothetical protein [Comamonas sp.]MDR3064736.1 hypothetical protein [Comamonas sp.]MPS93311.1 hypothetical protein [Comamonas sp.]